MAVMGSAADQLSRVPCGREGAVEKAARSNSGVHFATLSGTPTAHVHESVDVEGAEHASV